ncbi:MAG: MerC domain-containing protein [Turneriella sp.]|nr:MerC domain-containing protein [Turneriella sp.]
MLCTDAAHPNTKDKPEKKYFSNLWDKAGVVFSGLCLIDCVVLPLLSVLLFSIESSLLVKIDLHQLLLPAIIVTAAVAFYHSYRRHRAHHIAILGLLGVALLTASVWGEGTWHPSVSQGVSLCGSLLLLAAHSVNLWQHRQRRCQPESHVHEHSAQVP